MGSVLDFLAISALDAAFGRTIMIQIRLKYNKLYYSAAAKRLDCDNRAHVYTM